MTTDNPWAELPTSPPFILPIDWESIGRLTVSLNESSPSDHAINANSIPEPFIGNPSSASVVFLNLNPGDGEEDRTAHADPHFRKAILLNLRHALKEYPFYPLNPEFAWTPCARWWRPRLRQLFDVGGLNPEVVANRLCVIEWFPYHSRKLRLPQTAVCKSQEYSFRLALGAQGKLIVGMRARPRWKLVHPDFDRIPYLRNPQQTYVSPGNAGEHLFAKIVEALR